MILANLCGFIFSKLDLNFFRDFMSFKPLLNASLIKKLLLCKLTGVVNMGSPILSFIRLVSLTLFLVLMLINRMELPRGSIDILLKSAHLFLPILICHLNIGMRHS
jgi:hypothetical protein